MKDLLYFPDSKLLCWVAGYTSDGNTSNVLEIIEALKRNAEKFASVAGVEFSAVRTEFIQKSSRYKYMRVFFAEVETVPDSAFVFTNYKSAFDWLYD